jgi:hypothetical protein
VAPTTFLGINVADRVLIPKGGLAWGTVTEAQPKRRMARGGKMKSSWTEISWEALPPPSVFLPEIT